MLFFFSILGLPLSSSYWCYIIMPLWLVSVCVSYLFIHNFTWMHVCTSLRIVFSAFYFTPHFIYENMIRFSLKQYSKYIWICHQFNVDKLKSVRIKVKVNRCNSIEWYTLHIDASLAVSLSLGLCSLVKLKNLRILKTT